MTAIGGYFSLELNKGTELHSNALRLNAGRYALEYILKARGYRKVYLPYYICASVLQPIHQLGIEFEFYHINDSFEPITKLQPKDDEVVLYVNYFGLKNHFSSFFCNTYRNTILDQTQAFYSEPGRIEDKFFQCDTFYSCRKFFGVSDGAYLYTNCLLNQSLALDESFERLTFLTKRIDRSPQEGYEDFHENDKKLSTVGIKRMSRLTETMMKGIDYTEKAKRRINNFRTLNRALCETNRFKWDLDIDTVPLVYPYFVENGSILRQYLIDNSVFCARYWPSVFNWCKQDDLEYQLAEHVVYLPIDQRYETSDMNIIIGLIKRWM